MEIAQIGRKISTVTLNVWRVTDNLSQSLKTLRFNKILEQLRMYKNSPNLSVPSRKIGNCLEFFRKYTFFEL